MLRVGIGVRRVSCGGFGIGYITGLTTTKPLVPESYGKNRCVILRYVSECLTFSSPPGNICGKYTRRPTWLKVIK